MVFVACHPAVLRRLHATFMSPPLVRRLASCGDFHENIAPEDPCQSVGGRDRGCNDWMADRVKLGRGSNDWALVFLGENVSHPLRDLDLGADEHSPQCDIDLQSRYRHALPPSPLPQLGCGIIRKCARVYLGSGGKKPKLWSRRQCGAVIMYCAVHPWAADNGASTATVAEKSPQEPGKRAGAPRRGGCVHCCAAFTSSFA
jgi:hypothetical protein